MGMQCLLKPFCQSTIVLPAKKDSDIMFCLQSYQNLKSIDH